MREQKKITPEAFYECPLLILAEISDTVTLIGNYAFYKCSGLETVTIEEGVETIGNSHYWRKCEGNWRFCILFFSSLRYIYFYGENRQQLDQMVFDMFLKHLL